MSATAERLRELATAALRKNAPRQYQMSWSEIVDSGLYSHAEQDYVLAASPSVVLRLLNRLDAEAER